MLASDNQILKVESLSVKHFSMPGLRKMTWLQMMFIKNLISEAETTFPVILPTRQPKCLLALEGKDPIATIVIEPLNRRGSCWSIYLPELIKEPQQYTSKQIFKRFLQHLLKKNNSLAKSWLIRIPTWDLKNISLCRELGFQPLKIVINWEYKCNKSKIKSNFSYEDNNLTLEKLTKNNVPILWSIKKISDPVHLREMLDNRMIDLLDRNKTPNWILISKDKYKKVAIAGLVTPINSENNISLEFIRDVSWDLRITHAIPRILSDILINEPNISIESSSEDRQLNKLLEQQSWEKQSEEIILGRSIWKRKTNKKLIFNENSLESIIGGLKTNQPPLPTPSIETN